MIKILHNCRLNEASSEDWLLGEDKVWILRLVLFLGVEYTSVYSETPLLQPPKIMCVVLCNAIKPVYNDHPLSHKNVALIGRWSLGRGQNQWYNQY